MKSSDDLPELTFENVYKAILEIILHGTKEQQHDVWKKLNEGEGVWVWMRAKVITEMFEAASAKGKEEFTMMCLKRHLDSGDAVLLKYEFFDPDHNIRYRQYKFRDNTIHRVPIASEGMDPLTYKVALNRHFLGDYMEMHSSDGTIKRYLLETEDKVECCNAGSFFRYYNDKGEKREQTKPTTRVDKPKK